MILLHPTKLFPKVSVNSFKKVAVLFGGKSSEREVSLKSVEAVLKVLRDAQIDVIAIDVIENFVSRLMQERVTHAFILVHGRGGEDGSIQGVLESLNIPYTGSNILASALAMDKFYTKQIWKACHLPTPSYVLLNNEEDCINLEKNLRFPLAIKPLREGSSIGIKKVEDKKEAVIAWSEAKRHDSRVLAEEWVTGKEFTVTFLHDHILPPIRLNTPNVFYDFNAKYRDTTTQYSIPCGLSKNQESEIMSLAERAYKALRVSGWGRIDILKDSQDRFWLLEVNTVPGLTNRSLVPLAANAIGINFKGLILLILATSNCSRD